jgi:SAM-dependent methyltransferase
MASHYQDYVSDAAWLQGYDRYQQVYKVKPRKSDVDLASIVAEVARGKDGPVRLLDIGCSTGNLLRVIRAATHDSDMSFVGADLAASSIEAARAEPDLADMRFELWDVTQLPDGERFDIIVMAAVAFFLDDAEFSKALTSIHRALKPGGVFIAWELVSTYPDYRVSMVEHSPFYNGRPHHINIRSLNMLEAVC